jgi:hypothetical protein
MGLAELDGIPSVARRTRAIDDKVPDDNLLGDVYEEVAAYPKPFGWHWALPPPPAPPRALDQYVVRKIPVPSMDTTNAPANAAPE